MASKPSAAARRVVCTNASRTRARSAAFISRGGGSDGENGSAEGAIGSQPPDWGPISLPPSQGVWLEPLRPAWASWIDSGTSLWRRTASSTRRNAVSLSSEYSPRQLGVMRPIASTAVASTHSSAAPPRASCPRWIRCQSLALPSIAEYWHIGETMMRFESLSSRRLIGWNRALATENPFIDAIQRETAFMAQYSRQRAKKFSRRTIAHALRLS